MKSATNVHGIQAFTYRSMPLDKSRTEIRLLRLLHARDPSAPLACRIFVSALGPSGPRHPYKALSYVWGDPAKIHTISVLVEPRADGDIDDADADGKPDHASAVEYSDGESVAASLLLGIIENLHAALVALRDADEDVTLWIDQICINQEDNAEKESQVGLMGRVYSSASQVIVWLGPEADGPMP
jgi:hypothetical protein